MKNDLFDRLADWLWYGGAVLVTSIVFFIVAVTALLWVLLHL